MRFFTRFFLLRWKSIPRKEPFQVQKAYFSGTKEEGRRRADGKKKEPGAIPGSVPVRENPNKVNCPARRETAKSAVPSVSAGQLFLQQTQQPKENDRTDHSGDQAADNAAAAGDAKQAEDPAAEKATDDTNQQVNPESETGSFHQPTGDKTGQSSDKNKQNDVHNICI